MQLVCLSFHHIKTKYANFQAVRFEDPEQFYGLVNGERVLLQTGTRVEVYAYTENIDSIFEVFTKKSGLLRKEVEDFFNVYFDKDAREHLFRMTGCIESRVLGETYIPLAVESSFQMAERNGAAGPDMKELFEGAIRVGEKARFETKIEGSMPVADIALQSIAEEIPEIDGKKIVLLGAGTTGRKIAGKLSKNKAEVIVINRNPDIGQITVQKVGGTMHDYSKLTETLGSADVLICATLASHYRVLPEMIEKRSSPLVIVDVSPFGNVNPEVALIGGVILKNGELEKAVKQNHETAESEIQKVEKIIQMEL
jgi:glutamyl-tRNA reductase